MNTLSRKVFLALGLAVMALPALAQPAFFVPNSGTNFALNFEGRVSAAARVPYTTYAHVPPTGFAFGTIDPQTVTIYRDSLGIPHIHGRTDAATAYGLAWANCEDDFQNIQVMMLAARGRLGEFWGRKGAMLDYVAHLLRVQDQAAISLRHAFSPDFQALIEGHVQGVNAYAAAHPDAVLLSGVFPVTPQDEVATYLLSLYAMGGIAAPIQQIAERSIEERLGIGSNAFAFGPAATQNGHTYLGINSHQPLEGIFSWYECHLKSDEGMDTYGSTFPGGFCVFHGGNENLGWAHTLIGADVHDIYRLRTHPHNKNLYWYNGEWKAFDRRDVELRVKVGFAKITVTKEILWSVHGPALRNRDGVYAIRTGLMAEVRAGEEWYRMNKVRNFAEFKSVLQHYNAFQGLNVVYADREGNIYSAANVLMPTGRDSAHDWRTILPGDRPELVWPFQFHPHEALPQVLNPQAGFVFNTNNTVMCPTDSAEALDITQYPENQWGWDRLNNNRAARLLEIMAEHSGPLSWEDFKRIKYDQHLPQNSQFMAQMKPLFDVDTTQYPDIAGLVGSLQTWDRNFTPESEGAAVFSVAIYELWVEQKGGGLRFFQEGFNVSPERAVRTLRKVQARFRKHYHRQRILLGEMLRHSRGRVDLPAGGFADVLGALIGEPGADGRFRATVGDSFVMLMDFSPSGTRAEAIHAYGASSDPTSPHYTDQMELFLKQQTRPVQLDMDWHRTHAARTYNPQ